MITGTNPKQVFDHVVKGDDANNPTKWGIGVLSMDDKNNLLTGAIMPDGAINYQEIVLKTVPILKKALKHIKNYSMFEGVAARDYVGEEITDEVISSIPTVIQYELLEVVTKVNFASREEVKN